MEESGGEEEQTGQASQNVFKTFVLRGVIPKRKGNDFKKQNKPNLNGEPHDLVGRQDQDTQVAVEANDRKVVEKRVVKHPAEMTAFAVAFLMREDVMLVTTHHSINDPWDYEEAY